MSGSRSGGRVLVTACSRNSLANTVWAVIEESPSKAETASSSSSGPYSVSAPSMSTGEEPAGGTAEDVGLAGPPLSGAEPEGLRLLLSETASSRSMLSMFARRDSKWSILRSLC